MEPSRSPSQDSPLGLQYHLTHRLYVLSSLVLSYIVELIFTVFEFDNEVVRKHHPLYRGHTFSSGEYWNGWVTDANFVYGFMEISSRGLIFVSAYLAIKYRVMLKMFSVCATLEIIDMFDYWLFRNDGWFTTGIEFNYIKIGIIFFCAWKEYTKQSLQK